MRRITGSLTTTDSEDEVVGVDTELMEVPGAKGE